MSTDEFDIRVGEYVLGVMTLDERLQFEARLQRDPAIREQARRWEIVLTSLEPGWEMAPPDKLWSRLARAVEQEPAAGDFRTVRHAEGLWIAIGPGLEKKHLYRDPLTGLESCLIRMQPGAVFEAHHHADTEECLVLEGDLMIGDLRLEGGDYQAATPDSDHPVLRSESGALLYVRGVVHGGPTGDDKLPTGSR